MRACGGPERVTQADENGHRTTLHLQPACVWPIAQPLTRPSATLSPLESRGEGQQISSSAKPSNCNRRVAIPLRVTANPRRVAYGASQTGRVSPHQTCRPSPRDSSGERVAEGRVRGCASARERASCERTAVVRPPSSAFGTFSPRIKRGGRRATMAWVGNGRHDRGPRPHPLFLRAQFRRCGWSRA
jgi:hypothetical protein